MRIVGEKTIAMGDMTQDGSEFFGRILKNKIENGEDDEKRKLSRTEKKLLEINPKNIKDKIEKIQKLAWDKGIRLAGDDPYDLLVHPNGSWEILILDLSGVSPVKGESIDELESERKTMFEQFYIIRNHLLQISNEEKEII